MNPEETMVEEQIDDVPADDAPVEDVAEEEADESESLESLTGGAGSADSKPAEEGPPATEPGWIKKRVEKAVNRAVAETEARMRAEFDRQMAPLRERALNEEARELVRQGEFKSLDRAKEYLQLKQGMPVAAPEPQQQPRNNQGQFAPKDDPVVSARIDLLAHQADRIKASRGIDVMAEFNSNAEIKSKVLSGEMDFYEVAEQMAERPRRKPPAPTRSPNGASGKTLNAIESMSDEAFERMDRRIKEEGARYTLK